MRGIQHVPGRFMSLLYPLAATAALIGCDHHPPASVPTIDVAVLDRQREQLLLAEEPVGAITLGELRQKLVAGEDGTIPTLDDVVVVGKVGHLDASDRETDPEAVWQRGASEFRLLDATAATGNEGAAISEEEAAHAHEHADGNHDDCEFCKKLAAAKAPVIVRFLDGEGNVVPYDARAVFRFDGNDDVVIQGKAAARGGSIVVTATGLFIQGRG